MTTVMVVEDDPAFLNRFCKIVASDIELELFAAVADVASARQAMSKAAPDVLLTDLGLPDGSGIDLIRETARRHPDTDIMVITVFGDEDHVIASIEAGATGYILKDSLPAGVRPIDQTTARGGLSDQPDDRQAVAQAAQAPRHCCSGGPDGGNSALGEGGGGFGFHCQGF